MALSRGKYKRLPDLYVRGVEIVLIDGTPLWVQVLNPFQADEARHDAQVARSRLVMALQKHGSDEMAFVETALWQDGLDGARDMLVDIKSGERLIKAVESIDNDPDWTEKLDIIKRSDEDKVYEAAEQELLAELQLAYINEINERADNEAEYTKQKWAAASREEIRDEYVKLYIERRGSELAVADYRVTEIWYGARVCEGVRLDDGSWDHAACEGHQVQAFETRQEVRELPTELSALLASAYETLSMTQRDAKDLDRPASSSDSSRRPSKPEESTPSTQDETPSTAPGTSRSPSLTPSPS